jgi:NAD(P)-dependent dehydrogenase (short-subunit alcohol dehydrogenase family)
MPEEAAISSELRAALVVEAMQPIARTVARTLARNGYAVAVHSERARVEVDDLCAEIASAGGKAAAVTGDLADRESILRVVAEACAAVGPLSLLVNNLSVFEPSADCERRVAISLRAPIFLAQIFAQQIPGGADAAIINLMGQVPMPHSSKVPPDPKTTDVLAIDMAAFARAFAPRIRVNAVTAGATFETGDVADAVLYLAQARSITGATLAVGGRRVDRRRS